MESRRLVRNLIKIVVPLAGAVVFGYGAFAFYLYRDQFIQWPAGVLAFGLCAVAFFVWSTMNLFSAGMEEERYL